MGPLLFIIYINDLDLGLVSKISKFADDTKMGIDADSDAAVKQLQEDLRKVGVLIQLKHIFPNTYQRIKSICSPAKVGLVVIDLITSPVVSWRGWETPPPPKHRGSAVLLCMTSSEVSGAGGRAIIFILW